MEEYCNYTERHGMLEDRPGKDKMYVISMFTLQSSVSSTYRRRRLYQRSARGLERRQLFPASPSEAKNVVLRSRLSPPVFPSCPLPQYDNAVAPPKGPNDVTYIRVTRKHGAGSRKIGYAASCVHSAVSTDTPAPSMEASECLHAMFGATEGTSVGSSAIYPTGFQECSPCTYICSLHPH